MNGGGVLRLDELDGRLAGLYKYGLKSQDLPISGDGMLDTIILIRLFFFSKCLSVSPVVCLFTDLTPKLRDKPKYLKFSRKAQGNPLHMKILQIRQTENVST